MARHLATIGRLTIWLNEPVNRQDENPTVLVVQEFGPAARLPERGAQLSLDESVELARLLIKTAAQHGWGSEDDKQRVIAWAQVKK